MALTRLGPNTVNLTSAVTGTLPVANGGTNLTSGSGTARTLTFSQTGQSASLMYVGSKWRIINTGAAVA